MPDLERGPSLFATETLAAKTTTRETNLHLPPDNPFVPLDCREKVIEVVSHYIKGRKACREIAWADLLATQLEKFKKLSYSLRLGLFLSATDYNVSESNAEDSSANGSAFTRAYDFQSYADLFEYLETKVRICSGPM